ncbi:heavy metal-binding domain-containing protein [Crenobacter intestini]|uniref:YbjQ family protein n=1 Tax=Crenobacter intestini TaxID=2563443 RepID=A0A4T0V1Q4_9NEIS|nr:heavy metal-binding domain-containing protein [Crenobacter intestini]TIC85217.1 YbjQ family protein [Crenobacter intestini]
MKVQDIEIHVGEPNFPFTPIRRVEAKCESATQFSSAPSIDEANAKLREMAAGLGANAVIDVKYDTGVSVTSWRSMKATGIAVKKDSDDRPCPVCAELIKRAATKCRFCGENVPEAEPRIERFSEKLRREEKLREVQLAQPVKATNNSLAFVWVMVAMGVLYMIFTAMAS